MADARFAKLFENGGQTFANRIAELHFNLSNRAQALLSAMKQYAEKGDGVSVREIFELLFMSIDGVWIGPWKEKLGATWVHSEQHEAKLHYKAHHTSLGW